MLIFPFVPPKQLGLLVTLLAVIAEGALIVKSAVELHPFASVTITSYDPAERLVILVLPSPVGLPGPQL
jgi:hypothetical protein